MNNNCKPLPEVFLLEIKNLLDPAEWEAFEQAHYAASPTSVRLNPRKASNAFADQKSILWEPHGRYLEERPVFTLDPLFHSGAYYVQEAGSMLLGYALDQIVNWQQDLKILDLCAAPGGKSTQILSRLNSSSVLLSNEIDFGRYEILQENLSKWGLPQQISTAKSPSEFSHLNGLFDILIIDAPCSGEGMMRKDPQAISHWSLNNVLKCYHRQKDILQSVFNSLKPGGILFYSTCTFNKAENDEIGDWLITHFGMEPVSVQFPEGFGVSTRAGQYAQVHICYPHKVLSEGFSFQIFRKSNQIPESTVKGIRVPELRKVSFKSEGLTGEWLENGSQFTLFQTIEGELSFGPSSISEILTQINWNDKKTKAGTRLATKKGNNWLPDHELALSIHLNPGIPVLDLDLKAARQYLKGEIPLLHHTSGEPWICAAYEGLGLGWLKNLGTRYNNYFPKHRRIRMNLPN